jgi:hypothetical protein
LSCNLRLQFRYRRTFLDHGYPPRRLHLDTSRYIDDTLRDGPHRVRFSSETFLRNSAKPASDTRATSCVGHGFAGNGMDIAKNHAGIRPAMIDGATLRLSRRALVTGRDLHGRMRQTAQAADGEVRGMD